MQDLCRKCVTYPTETGFSVGMGNLLFKLRVQKCDRVMFDCLQQLSLGSRGTLVVSG